MAQWTCRWHGVQAHDIFINYRVATDADLAEKIALSLNGLKKSDGESFSVFLDKKCLNVGEDWEVGFLNGLQYSKLIVLLISEAGIQRIQQADTRQDNVLLEYEYALDKLEKKEASLLPVLVGRVADDGAFYDFNAFDTSKFPDAPHHSPKSDKNVRETMTALFRLQGIRLNPKHYEDQLAFIQQTADKVTVHGAPAVAVGDDLKDELVQVLSKHSLESYATVMAQNGYSPDVLADMTEKDQDAMEATCGVLPGHKMKFRKLFQELAEAKQNKLVKPLVGAVGLLNKGGGLVKKGLGFGK